MLTKEQRRVRKSLTEESGSKPIPDTDWLSLGNTLLNLAVSGKANVGIPKSTYLWFVGDSSSGKSWWALQVLAEASKNPSFDKHRFILDNSENGVLMDIPHYFGKSVARRLEPPKGTRSDPIYSSTIEEFYFRLDDARKAGKPFIYILDSMDALDSKDDEAKFQEHKQASDSGKETKGSYGMAKAKVNSQNIKRVVNKLRDTGSILIIINQTRDKINSPFPDKTSAGGRALKFYSHLEMWCSVKGDLKRVVLGKDRVYGADIQIDVRKNRISGKDCKIVVPFLKNHGFDEVGGCVDYLVDEGYWKMTKKVIKATDYNIVGKREKVVAEIERRGLERKLSKLVQFHWRKIDEATNLKRKRRYV